MIRTDGRAAIDGTQDLPACPAGVHFYTLDNGLTVIIQEDHSAPVVSAQAWCKAGSADEGRWLGAGLSHLLEHMLFKGTASRGPGRIDQEVQEAGGYMNAYTSFDRTVYWINVPNTGARVAVDILGDIMQHATFPPEELAKEKQVILREMDMLQDDPGRRSSRRLFETAYTLSPYRYTIIGHPDIFNQLERLDIEAYYREKYSPNNLFMVVVGDVGADETLAQISASFAGARARSLPPGVIPAEPRQTAPREVIEEAPIELAHFHISWHIPDVRHPDIPTLDVLATLLGNGRSSRLYRQVREKAGLVHSIDAWTYTLANVGLFGLSAVADADKCEESRRAMMVEIQRMKDEGVSPEELTKAVKQFVAITLSARKTMQGQAQDLGNNWLMASDLNFSERYLASIKRVTPEALQRAAREYLTVENRTIYALLPAGTIPRVVAPVVAAVESPVQKFEWPNGLRLLVKEDHRLPFIQFRAVLLGGLVVETAANNGITALATKLLLKGTRNRTAEQIADAVESLGGSIDSYSGNNSFGVHLEVLSGDFADGLEIWSDALLHPVFPERELERERLMQLAQIKAQRDHLLQSAVRAMRRSLFGDRGYGLDVHGNESSLLELRRADLEAFHRQWAAPRNCVLAIYGDVAAGEVRAAVEAHFGAWGEGLAAPGKIETAAGAELSEVQRAVETRDKRQAVVAIGFPATTLFDPDRFALELIQEACSDLGSRLFTRIRDQLGLAYYVGAQNFLGLAPGFFTFYAGTEPDKADLVEREILLEIEALRQNGLTPDELRRAKAKVIGQKKIARQDLAHYAITTALDELYGLGYGNTEIEDPQFEAVTLEQTQAIARKYFQPSGYVVSLVRPGGTPGILRNGKSGDHPMSNGDGNGHPRGEKIERFWLNR